MSAQLVNLNRVHLPHIYSKFGVRNFIFLIYTNNRKKLELEKDNINYQKEASEKQIKTAKHILDS